MEVFSYFTEEHRFYRVFFLTVPPNFSAKKKNVGQPTRIFCTSRISWNRISGWLPIVFILVMKIGRTVKKTTLYVLLMSEKLWLSLNIVLWLGNILVKGRDLSQIKEMEKSLDLMATGRRRVHV